jgi:hypothetical protein
MTIDAVRGRSKTVTRRHVDTWQTLAAGDRLTLIEKGMGLPRGAKQVVLAEVEVVDVRVESLRLVKYERNATAAEGLGHMSVSEFERFWLSSHGYRPAESVGWFWHRGVLIPAAHLECRRIEWRYLP